MMYRGIYTLSLAGRSVYLCICVYIVLYIRREELPGRGDTDACNANNNDVEDEMYDGRPRVCGEYKKKKK